MSAAFCLLAWLTGGPPICMGTCHPLFFAHVVVITHTHMYTCTQTPTHPVDVGIERFELVVRSDNRHRGNWNVFMCMTSFWQGTRFQLIYVDIRSFMRFQFLVVVTGVPGESPQKGLHERACVYLYITA